MTISSYTLGMRRSGRRDSFHVGPSKTHVTRIPIMTLAVPGHRATYPHEISTEREHTRSLALRGESFRALLKECIGACRRRNSSGWIVTVAFGGVSQETTFLGSSGFSLSKA